MDGVGRYIQSHIHKIAPKETGPSKPVVRIGGEFVYTLSRTGDEGQDLPGEIHEFVAPQVSVGWNFNLVGQPPSATATNANTWVGLEIGVSGVPYRNRALGGYATLFAQGGAWSFQVGGNVNAFWGYSHAQVSNPAHQAWRTRSVNYATHQTELRRRQGLATQLQQINEQRRSNGQSTLRLSRSDDPAQLAAVPDVGEEPPATVEGSAEEYRPGYQLIGDIALSYTLTSVVQAQIGCGFRFESPDSDVDVHPEFTLVLTPWSHREDPSSINFGLSVGRVFALTEPDHTGWTVAASFSGAFYL